MSFLQRTFSSYSELLRGKFLSKAGNVLFYQTLAALIGFASHIVYTRLLGVNNYGILTLGLSWIALLSIAGKVGFDTGALRFIPTFVGNMESNRIRPFFLLTVRTVMPMSMFVGAGAAVYFILTQSFPKPQALGLAVLMALIPLRSLLDVMLKWFHAKSEWSWAILPRSVIFNLLFIAIIATSVTAGVKFTPLSVGYTYVSAFLLTLTICLVKWYNVFGKYLSLRGSINVKSIFKVTIPLSLVGGMQYFYKEMDVIMLGFFLQPEDIALYGIAIKINLVVMFGLTTINYILAPQISGLYHSGRKEELQEILDKASRMLLMISVCSAVGIILLGKLVLSFFGAIYVSAFSALLILTAGQCVNTITGPVGSLLSLTDHQNIVLKITGISVMINLVLNLWLIPVFGIIGAATATAVSISFRNIVMAVMVKRQLAIRPTFVV